MITLFVHIVFVTILSLSIASHKSTNNQGESTQCQTLKKP